MATDKKRVIVYLDPTDKEHLDKVAHDMGCSVSRLCGDVLMTSLPQLEITAQAMKVARTDPQKAMRMMQEAATAANQRLVSEVEDL